ncbi:hypothetical protein DPMN_084360 [Dreissena polymorpha]|uniref:C-type lectin domain-containing protein n=1 Tax=Dreissena polymorpha TaxID=45954 RepID=A0A9D4BIH3_DREPO|nr:hypothetical protein DPMN_084360 [Dreissena polymorpha]
MELWPKVANKFLSFEPNINLLILNLEKQDIANKYSLEPCMSASGIEGATALSYDQMVRFARDHSMLGNEKCSSVLFWADGQPDGGDLEECVYLNRSESGEYLWHDVRCDFGQDFRPAFVCGWQVTDIIE